MGVKKEQNVPETELTLESVSEQLEDLESDLVNPLNDAYTHLHILLKIVKLQYEKMRLLDREIAKKQAEFDKLEIIFSDDMSRSALELLDNGGDLVQTRENRRKDVETLKREKENFEAEFIESKKKAQDAIDALDRG